VTPRALLLIVLACCPLLSAGCGKKGPPLPPLRLVPNAVADVSARRTGQEVTLRFVLPTTNANGGGRIDLDHVEVYAMTVAPGAVTPPNRDLLTKARLVVAIPVRPAPIEGEPAAPDDKRPGPGEPVVFVEKLTEDKLRATEHPSLRAAEPPSLRASELPATAAGASPAPAATYPVRIYAVRGISRAGRPGPPAPRLSVPLLALPAAPSAVGVKVTERALVISWRPPVAEPDSSPILFNVYREDPGAPLNQTPLGAVTFEHPVVEFGREQCFRVRSVQTVQTVTLESVASEPACVTPADSFPPAVPKGLQAVAEEGAINLVWEPNTEADLAGYVVLRADAAGGTLQSLVPQPIREASYRDATVKPGVRYVYAIVAVDSAKPRNTSAPSDRQEITAR
jgi:hypothetical protein